MDSEKFKDWFSKKLKVGRWIHYPNEKFISSFDVVINVSDENTLAYVELMAKHGKPCFWFPMNECRKDIGLNSIYGAMTILYDCELANKSVYLHCHAGANRSPSVAAAYYFMRAGEHWKDDPPMGYINRLVANCNSGYLPPKTEMEDFLKKCFEVLSVKRVECKDDVLGSGGWLDWVKIDTIYNF